MPVAWAVGALLLSCLRGARRSLVARLSDRLAALAGWCRPMTASPVRLACPP